MEIGTTVGEQLAAVRMNLLQLQDSKAKSLKELYTNENRSVATAQTVPVKARFGSSRTRRRNARGRMINDETAYSRKMQINL